MKAESKQVRCPMQAGMLMFETWCDRVQCNKLCRDCKHSKQREHSKYSKESKAERERKVYR